MLELNSPYSKFIAQLRNTAFHLGIRLDFLDLETIQVQNGYGFDFGKIVLNSESLADSAKMKAENLLFMNTEKVELWQNGELASYAAFDNFISNERIQKSIQNKFLTKTFPKFDKEKQAFFFVANKTIEHNKEQFQKTPPTNQEFHKAVGKLLSYLRKYLNPQSNRNDVIELANLHTIFKLLFQLQPNYEKSLNGNWVFRQFELVSEVFSFEELKENTFLSYLESGDSQLLRAVLQGVQSSEKYGHRIANFEELGSLNKYANPIIDNEEREANKSKSGGFEHENILYVNFQNSASENGKPSRFSPLLSDYYLSLSQEKESLWLNPFMVSKPAENENSLFNSNDFEQTISHELSKQFSLIIGDFRTPTQEKFERGYQQVSEMLEVEIKEVFGEIPTKIATKNWMKWLVSSLQKLENQGSVCFLAPLDLAESESCISVRLILTELFGAIGIEKYISAPKPYAIYKLSKFKKASGGVGEKLVDYSVTTSMKVQDIDNQTIGLFNLQYKSSCKAWLSQSESHYFDQIPLLKSKQNEFGFHLFEDKKVDEKLPRICFQRNASNYYFMWNLNETETTHQFQKLTPKAIFYFRKLYEGQLAIPKYLSAEILLGELKEISRFSKQMPVLQKWSVRLSEKLLEGKLEKVPISNSVTILQEIEGYSEKIKRLAKGANERKTTFAIMQKHLRSMKVEIEQQLETEKELSEKLETVQEDTILFYIYAVLQNPTLQEKYRRIHQNYLPRVALFTDFWTWSKLGKELVESFQLLNPTKEGIGNWESEGEIEIQKPTFDSKRKRLFSEGKLVLSEIPEQVFLPKLGKTLLIKHLLKQYSQASSKSEMEKMIQICVNYWQVLEKIRIFSESTAPFYFNYNEQIS
ncbi:MAG: hypothetical protein ACJAWV_002153 [Flammeovirgaceae bacterium]|jgi:hypothetical protein